MQPDVVWLLVLFVLFIAAWFTIDTRKWLDHESKLFLRLIVAVALLAIVVVYFVPQDMRTAVAAIFAATLASAGWVITNHQNRVFNRIQYTNGQIDQYRNDAEIQRCIIRIRREYISVAIIGKAEVSKIQSAYNTASNYDPTTNQTPILHSIIHILNFFERLAYLYQSNLVDKRAFYRHFNIILGKQVVRLQNVIRTARASGAGDKPYNDLKDLLLAWYRFDIDSETELTAAQIDLSRVEEFYDKNSVDWQ